MRCGFGEDIRGSEGLEEEIEMEQIDIMSAYNDFLCDEGEGMGSAHAGAGVLPIILFSKEGGFPENTTGGGGRCEYYGI